MNYASGLPMALGMMGQPFGAMGKGGMKLADLIGQSKVSQVTRLGDFVHPSPPSHGQGIDSSYGQPPAKGPMPALASGGIRLGDLMNQDVQPFDMGFTAPPAPEKPGFFGKGSVGAGILAGLADGVSNWASAGRDGGHAVANMMQMQQMDATQEFDREKLVQQLEAKRQERLSPRVEQVGNTLGMLNPETQTYSPFFTAPQAFESYASALGYEPGTPEYQDAIRNYRLGAWSDDAMEGKRELEGVRFGNRKVLQDDRLDVQRRGQNIRSTDTRRGQDIRSHDSQRGQSLTAAKRAVRVRSIEEARKLPPGTLFMTPDGRPKIR